MKKKIITIALAIIGIASVSGLMVYGYYHDKDDRKPTDEYLDSEIKNAIIRINERDRVINELLNRIRIKDSMLVELQKTKTIITNKYYQNEKIVLTSSDSVNHMLRLHNQRLFESDYFSGRISPRHIK